MDAFINWFRGLSRAAQIAIFVAVAIFTPAVGIIFSIIFNGVGALFTIIGFILGFVNWGVAFLCALGFGGYWFYRWINSEEEVEEDNSWNPFL